MTNGSFVLRLSMPHPSRDDFIVNDAGILCVGALEHQGCPALLLLADEGARNQGASVTNGIERLLAFLSFHAKGRFPVREANLVQLDSLGDFNHVHATWHDRVGVTWSPVWWPSTKPKSKASFLSLFGTQAQQIDNTMASIAAPKCTR